MTGKAVPVHAMKAFRETRSKTQGARCGVIGVFIDIILPAALWPWGFDSASNRSEYQEYFLGGKGGWRVGLTTLPRSCAECLEIWESEPLGTLRACPGL